MDHPTSTTSDPRAFLADAVQCLVDQDHAHTGLLIAATNWADAHPLPEDQTPGVFTDTDLRLTGDGVPTVANAAVAEFAAALRRSTPAGECLIASAMELRHRLPRIWAGLLAGTIRPGRARQIADHTLTLSREAADHVDRHLAPLADRVSRRQIARTVTAAILQHMPDRAADHAARESDPRCAYFRHEPGDDTLGPRTYLSATLDLPDGLALDAAVTDGARHLAQLGVDGHDQALRSIALADPDPDTEVGGGSNGQTTRPRKPMTVFLHLGVDALTAGHGVARFGNLNLPVALELVQRWLGDPACQITVKPVIDLNEPIMVDAYEIPDRIRDHVLLREPCCVFPWCDKPSAGPGVDLDHIVAHAAGGATSTDNLAPLCRAHHRLKTHTRWHYHRDRDGTYVWTSPHGHVHRRQRDGTVSDTDLPPPTPLEQRDPARSIIRAVRRRAPTREPTGPPVVDDTPPPF